jgi:hypothetical protein
LRLLPEALRTAGRTVLIVVGAGYGLLRGLRVLGNVTRDSAGLEMIEARVDTIHVAVARLADQTEQLQSRMALMVTRDELSQALDGVFGRIERGVDARFEHQTRSVEALRMMIGQTDELLQRVLDGLESMKAEADDNERRTGREWDLTQAGR